jgi:hypothetical protein
MDINPKAGSKILKIQKVQNIQRLMDLLVTFGKVLFCDLHYINKE